MESLQQIPLGELRPSPFNPRQSFDPAKMEELVNSIKAGEIHEPIIGRRVNGHIEIVAGERRFRAAKAAKLTTVPVIVKDLTDTQAMEVQIIENEQREDVSELDQAAGFQKLMKLDPATYTVDYLAKRLGLKPASIYLRLKLLALGPDGRELLVSGKIDAGHAVLIARHGEKDQAAIVKWMRETAKHQDGEMPSVRSLKAHITHNVRADLLSPILAEEQPAVAKRLAELQAKGVKVQPITESWYAKDKGVLSPQDYKLAGKKKCAHIEVGAVVMGAEEVTLHDICRDKKCKTHWPQLAAQRQQQARATREKKETAAAKEKRLAKERAEKAKRELVAASRGAVLLAILGTVRSVSKAVIAQLAAIALDYSGTNEFDEELKAAGVDTALLKPMGQDQLRAALLKASDRQLAQVAVVAALGDRLHYELPKVAKEFGVNLTKIQKQVQTAASAAAKAAAQPAPAKGTAGRKQAAAKRGKKTVH